jgi:hypothetical protein
MRDAAGASAARRALRGDAVAGGAAVAAAAAASGDDHGLLGETPRHGFAPLHGWADKVKIRRIRLVSMSTC